MGNKKTRQFKVGIFMLAGIVISTLLTILFGSGDFFREMIEVETYLNESVQGVENGSPVKMRGVQVGSVESITFVSSHYANQVELEETDIRYVLIRMTIDPTALAVESDMPVGSLIQREVERGLRVRLASQGLTGLAYLDLDYLDPNRHEPLDIYWHPEVYYLPSAPSILSRVSEATEDIIQRVEKVDVESLLANMESLLGNLNQSASELEIDSIQERIASLMDDVKATTERIRETVEAPEVQTIGPDVSATVASARELMEENQDRIGNLVEKLETVSEDLAAVTTKLNELMDEEFIEKTINNIEVSSDNVRVASESLPETMEMMQQTLTQLDRLVTDQQANLDVTMNNVRRISEDMKLLMADARRNPSRLLLSDPPPPINPSQR